MNATNYVAGFLFDLPLQRVALIEKQKPEWQRGRLNGIGGKIEEGELPIDAMRREFTEETGAVIEDWQLFCELKFRGGAIHFFKAIGDLHSLRSMEDEQVRIAHVAEVPHLRTIENLRWLIPMALDKDGVSAVVEDAS